MNAEKNLNKLLLIFEEYTLKAKLIYFDYWNYKFTNVMLNVFDN